MTGIPDLSAGRCQPGRSALHPDSWTGDATAAEHWAAARLCESCPVLAACRSWAVGSMPSLTTFTGVIAGMTRGMLEAERARRRHPGATETPPDRSWRGFADPP